MPRYQATSTRSRSSTLRKTRPKINRCRTLAIVDNAPLQSAAWKDVLRARARLEKLTLEIHRHEEVDQPGFDSWMAQTFPTLLSELRELAQQARDKSILATEIEREAFFSDRSPKQVWQEWRRNGGRRPAEEEHEDEADFSEENGAAPRDETGERSAGNQERQDDEPDEADMFESLFKDRRRPARGKERGAIRDLYRRLVLQLHPDRGGEWTPSRQRLWLQVQQAWANRDLDWLSRLEVEWEAALDRIGPASPVSQLRRAIAEIESARRDAQKRLRTYKTKRSWQFSIVRDRARLKESIQYSLREELQMLRAELRDLERVFALWERPAGQHRAKNPGRREREPSF